MIGSATQRKQEFSHKLLEILQAIKGNADPSTIADLIDDASIQLLNDEPLRIDEVLNELKMDYHGTLLSLAKYPSGGLLLSALADWQNDNKISEPLPQAGSSHEVIKEEPFPAKNYIDKDNAELYQTLSREFAGQEVKNAKSTYAWKYKSGQDNISNQHIDALNIFFLGTSTPPLFGKHNIDVCETGHIISQASLQKGLKGEPTLLVKGIATIDMPASFPLDALQDPAINGVSSGGLIETFRKTKTTVKGVGVESRLQLTMDEFLVSNLFRMLSKEPLATREQLVVNLSGHSRGGITTFIMADCADQFIQIIAKGEEGKDFDIDQLALSTGLGKAAVTKVIQDIKVNASKIKIHVCALDPVEGARSMSGWDPFGDYIPKFEIPVKGLTKPINCSYVAMPPSVNEITVLFAEDERRSGFKPTIPNTAEGTQLKFVKVPGKHGTLTGNYGNDGNAGQFAYPTFTDNKALQDAMLGIFDQSLLQLNHSMHARTELPAFPINTLRRIMTQPDYANTYQLLKKAAVAQSGQQAQFDDLSQDEILSLLYRTMEQNKADNVVIYDCLARDAKAAIEKHKIELLSLKKEWQKDTNIGKQFDRDPITEDRQVYIRGKKVKGTVMWKQHALSALVPVYLPDVLYYNRTSQIVPYEFKHDTQDELVLQFYHLKNKMASLAQTHKLARDRKVAALFDEDFERFQTLLKDALANPQTKPFAIDILHELMIDVDFKHHIMSANDFSLHLQKNIQDTVLQDLPAVCLATQHMALEKFMRDFGCHYLSTEEAHKMIDQINYLLPGVQMQYKDIWVDIQKKLQVMTELDQYLVNLEAYSENKSKTTYQNTNEVDDLIEVLRKLRVKMNDMSTQEAQEVLHKILDDYCNSKPFQGMFSRMVKSAPASVSLIHATMQAINHADIDKEVARLEEVEAEQWVREDLAQYIKGIQAYIDSYRITTPHETTRTLLADLLSIQARVDNQDIQKTAYELHKVLKEFRKGNDDYQKSGYVPRDKKVVKYDSKVVKEIDSTELARKAQKSEIAKANIGEKQRSINKLTN